MVRKKAASKSKPNLMPAVFIALLLGGLGIYLAVSGKGGASKSGSHLGLPDYASKNQKTITSYTKAAEYQDMLMYIPCYCGCGSHSGHLSVKNCFVKEGGGYDDHGANCEMCMDIVLEAVKMYNDGKAIPEIRSYINSKYGMYSLPTNTPLTPAEADISRASLPEDFNSLSDGLRLTPAGVYWAQFINVKLLQGTVLEPLIKDRVQPDYFYWKKIVGMYSADYSENSWIELHDLGAEAKVEPRISQGMDNIVTTRPFVYGHTGNVKKAGELLRNPNALPSAYQDFRPLLEGADGDAAGIAFVMKDPKPFADMMYFSLTSVDEGVIEKKVFYRISDSSALNMAEYEDKAAKAKEKGFVLYEVKKEENLLKITVVGDVSLVLHEDI